MKKLLLCLSCLCFTFQLVFCQHSLLEYDSLSNKASEYFESYKFGKAIDVYSDLYKKDSLNSYLLSKIASCNYRMGRYNKAKKGYSKLVEKDSLNTFALNHLGVIYSKEHNYNKAIDAYMWLVMIDSTNSYYYRMLGSMYSKCDDLLGALACYENCLKFNIEDISAIADLSGIYIKLENYEQADTLLSLGLKQDSTNLRLLRSKMNLNFATKKYRELLNIAEKIVSIKKDTNIYITNLMGLANYRIKNYSEAIVFFKKMIVQEHATDLIHYYLGVAYRNEHDIDSSIEHLEKAVELGESKFMSVFYTNLAISREQKGSYFHSIKAFQKAYKISGSKIILYHLARNYDLYYKDKQTAIKYYKSYIDSNDSLNVSLNGYSKYRISQLTEIIHFQADSL